MDEQEFTTKDGRRVLISNVDPMVYLVTHEGKEIGSISFTEVEHDNHTEVHLEYAEIEDSFKRQGIGIFILKCAKQIEGRIYCDLSELGSGADAFENHLTGDGPAFVRACKRLGLIEERSGESPTVEEDEF